MGKVIALSICTVSALLLAWYILLAVAIRRCAEQMEGMEKM